MSICDCVGLELVYYNRIVAWRVTFLLPTKPFLISLNAMAFRALV